MGGSRGERNIFLKNFKMKINHESISVDLKVNGYTSMFISIYTKGDNFCKFPVLGNITFQNGCSLRGQHPPLPEQILSIKIWAQLRREAKRKY